MEALLTFVLLVGLVAFYEMKTAPKVKAEREAYQACSDNARALLDHAGKLRKKKTCG